MADVMTIQLEGKSFSLDQFELGELEWLEDELGVSLDEINPASMKTAVRFVYLIKRRENPDFTLDDARKLRLEVFADDTAEWTEDAKEESPTVAAPASPRKRPAAKRKAAA